jgi:hypothetical protein
MEHRSSISPSVVAMTRGRWVGEAASSDDRADRGLKITRVKVNVAELTTFIGGSFSKEASQSQVV